MAQLHLIGNAHLDPTWLWTWDEGYAEIRATFRSALDRISQFKDFVFTCSSAAYYEWIEKVDPVMFREIQQCVKEKRWIIVGGWWVQPDCNAPSGESFARHALYSQNYYKEKFGVICKTGYNVDSFGHNGMLPQILQLSEMCNYVFQRPDINENKNLPGSVFLWESPDGSRVNTYRIPFGYGTSSSDNLKRLKLVTELAVDEQKPLMNFYGVGNHGGGPTVSMVKEFVQKMNEGFDIQFSSPDIYFDFLNSKAVHLEIFKGDLQHHASGCYSAYTAIKKSNRATEHALVEAECYEVMAQLLLGSTYTAQGTFNQEWKTLLYNQFHDILGGCSIEKGLEDAILALGGVQAKAQEFKNFALQSISSKINCAWATLDERTDFRVWDVAGCGAPLVIFNPHPWPVTMLVPIHAYKIMRIEDAHTKEVLPIQNARARYTNGYDCTETVLKVTLPPMGYRVCKVFLNQAQVDQRTSTLCLPSTASSLIAGANFLENKKVKLTFSNGMLNSIFDKSTKRELLDSRIPLCFEVLDETHLDTWAHRIFSFNNKKGEFTPEGLPELVESGDLRLVLKIKYRYKASTITVYYSLEEDTHVLSMKCVINWQEEFAMLRLSVTCNLEGQAQAIYSMPFGYITKEENGEEEPTQGWQAALGTVDQAGLALINDGQASACLNKNKMSLLLLRSPQFADHYSLDKSTRDSEIPCMDIGLHTITLKLLPCSRDRLFEIEKLYLEHSRPPSVVFEHFHQGTLPYSTQTLSIDNPHILISACKPSEDGEAFIVRLYALNEQGLSGILKSEQLGIEYDVQFQRPFEIKSFKIMCNKIDEVNFLENVKGR